ncbi:hypothetical protein D3C75_802660 [compost metagenome]
MTFSSFASDRKLSGSRFLPDSSFCPAASFKYFSTPSRVFSSSGVIPTFSSTSVRTNQPRDAQPGHGSSGFWSNQVGIDQICPSESFIWSRYSLGIPASPGYLSGMLKYCSSGRTLFERTMAFVTTSPRAKIAASSKPPVFSFRFSSVMASPCVASSWTSIPGSFSLQ